MPVERPVDRLDRVFARRLGAGLEIGLVDLDDVRARRLEIAQLLVDRLRVRERQAAAVGVVVVLGLLRHRERPGHGDLDPQVRERAQELDVAQLDGPRAPNRADDARHRVLVAGAIERDAWPIQVDAVEGGREAVRVALPTHLPVGDDVDAGQLHVPDGEPRRVVLCLLEERLRDAPQLPCPHARREAVSEPLAIDQPAWLRVAPTTVVTRRSRCSISSTVSRT